MLEGAIRNLRANAESTVLDELRSEDAEGGCPHMSSGALARIPIPSSQRGGLLR